MSEILEQETEPKYIEVYIQETGDLSRIVKDFELYKGQYIDYYIDIYVPITLSPSVEGHGVAVQTALMYTKRNGSLKTTIGYNAVIKETSVVKYGRTYNVYEQRIPQVYVKHIGEQTLIANINEIDTTTDPAEFVQIITSQTCPLVIQMSDYIDDEEVPDPSQLDLLQAEVNDLILNKQDKLDTNIQKTFDDGVETWQDSQTVVGAINNNTAQTELNRQQIATNTSNISSNTSRIATNEQDISNIKAEQLVQNQSINTNTSDIANLKAIVGTGEYYIGTYYGTDDPENESQLALLKADLTSYVSREEGRLPKGSDVVIYVQRITGGTDKNFKFIFSGSQDDWTFYEIPPIEHASNSEFGTIHGSYHGTFADKDLNVSILDGVVDNIYVLHRVNHQLVYTKLKDYLATHDNEIANLELQVGTNTTNIGTLNGKVSTLENTTDNILNGTTPIGKATSADNDGNGNNIVNTYLTQTAGVTKVQLREYALPRAFNDVSYLTSTGYSDEVPTDVNPIYSETSTAVGDTELFSAEKTIVNAEFDLGAKNSSTDTIYVSASQVCNVQFRLTTEVYNDSQWHTASIELSDNVQFTLANEIKKIQFGSTFTQLSDVLKIVENDKIRQTLEVITNTSESITFDVYSNTTYPSTFYLNTTSQTIQVAQGDLGEVLTITLTGVYDSEQDTLTFDIPEGLIINDSVMAQFILTLPSGLSDTTQVLFVQGNQDIITMVVPTLADNRTVPTIKDMSSTIADTLMLFKGVFEVDNGDIYLYTDITVGGDEVPTNLVTTDTDQIIEGKKTIKDTSLDFQNSNASGNASWQLEPDQYGQLGLYRTYNNIKSKMVEFNGNSIKPVGSNGNLGSATQKWANVYADNLNNGTNSIAIGDIANKNDIGLTIIPTPASTTLTDDEKNAIKSGGIVNGNISGLGQYQNYVFFPAGDLYSGYYMGFVVVSRNGYTRLYQYAINDSTNVLTFYGNKYIDIDSASNISISGLNSINAKTIPAYPSDTTKNYVLQQDETTGALSWNEVNGDIVDTGSDQSIEGQKTFLSQLRVKRPADGGSYFYVTPDGNGYNVKMGFSAGGQMMIHNGGFQIDRNLTPMTANSNLDLGTSSIMWRDLHLKGVLNDGTNSVSVADIKDIQDVIPAQASSSNQLADKDFVNSSVQTATANFRGNWATWTAVPSVATDYPEDFAGSKTPTVNDYLVVQDASGYTGQTLEGTWRFKYTGEWATDGKNGWLPEYQVNETPLTAAQLAALNSGITSAAVAQIGTNTTNIALKQNSTDNTLATDDKTIVGSINEIVGALGSLVQDVEDGFTGIAGELNGKQAISNLVTSLSSSSTDAQYPSAKCVYDLVGDVETLLTELNSGQGV